MLLLAYAIASPQLPAPQVRDSAGVRIVENGPRLKAPVRFRLADKPSYDVGGLHDDNLKAELTSDGNIRGAVRLSDGSMVVGDRHSLKLFDKAGKYLSSAGRQGAGPGEFGEVYATCLTGGDTIVVADLANSRIQIMTNKLAFVRNVPFATKRGFFPQRSGCLSNGSFLVASVDVAQISRATSKFFLTYDLTGKQLGEGLTLPDAPFDMITSREVEVTGVGPRFYFGNQLSPEIRVYSAAGKLEMLVRSADPMVPIKNSELATALSHISGSGSAASTSEIIARRNAAPHDNYWPAYNRVLADPDGTIWVQDFAKVGERTTSADAWTAFDPTGQLIGRLVIPGAPKGSQGNRVESFGKNDVLIRCHDKDGALHYTVYPLVKVP